MLLKVLILVKILFIICLYLDAEVLELNDNDIIEINHTPENWLNTLSNKDRSLNEFDESQVSLHVTPSTKKIKLSSDVQSYPSTPIMKPIMHSESDTKGKYD